jgi:hypothetical protein
MGRDRVPRKLLAKIPERFFSSFGKRLFVEFITVRAHEFDGRGGQQHSLAKDFVARLHTVVLGIGFSCLAAQIGPQRCAEKAVFGRARNIDHDGSYADSEADPLPSQFLQMVFDGRIS